MTDPFLDALGGRKADVLVVASPETPRADAFAEALAGLGLTVRLMTCSDATEGSTEEAVCVVRLAPGVADPSNLTFDTRLWNGKEADPTFAALLGQIGTRVGRPGLAQWAAIRLGENPEALRHWAEANPQDPAVEEAWGRLEALETDAIHAHLERTRAALSLQAPQPQTPPAMRTIQPEPRLAGAAPRAAPYAGAAPTPAIGPRGQRRPNGRGLAGAMVWTVCLLLAAGGAVAFYMWA